MRFRFNSRFLVSVPDLPNGLPRILKIRDLQSALNSGVASDQLLLATHSLVRFGSIIFTLMCSFKQHCYSGLVCLDVGLHRAGRVSNRLLPRSYVRDQLALRVQFSAFKLSCLRLSMFGTAFHCKTFTSVLDCLFLCLHRNLCLKSSNFSITTVLNENFFQVARRLNLRALNLSLAFPQVFSSSRIRRKKCVLFRGALQCFSS